MGRNVKERQWCKAGRVSFIVAMSTSKDFNIFLAKPEFSQSSCHWWQMCLLTCLAMFLKLCISVKPFRHCPCVNWCTWRQIILPSRRSTFPSVLPTSFPTSNKKSNLRISQLSVYSSSKDSFSTMPQFVCFSLLTFSCTILIGTSLLLWCFWAATQTHVNLLSKIYISLKLWPCSKN